MLDSGYILIHRKIVNWCWYGDLPTHMLFIHLLLTANWKDSQVGLVKIRRGQKLCALKTLAAETHLSERQVRTAISHLKSTGEVTCEMVRIGKSRVALYTVINYDKYQVSDGLPTYETTRERHVSDTSTTRERHDINKDNTDNTSNKGRRRVQKAPPPTKKERYKNTVWLSNEQHQILIDKYGEEDTTRLIELLDEYKIVNNKTYASDFHAIEKWVVKKLEEEKANKVFSAAFDLKDYTERPEV